MRIMIVTEVFMPSINGLALRLSEAIKYFCKEGHEVMVVTGKRRTLQFEGVNVQSVTEMRMPLGKKMNGAPSKEKLNKIMIDFAPQIVHIVNPAMVGIAAATCAKKMDVPYVVSFHSNYENMLKQTHFNYNLLQNKIWKSRRLLAHDAALVLSTSYIMKEKLVSHGIEGAHVLKRGVDLEKRHPDYKSEEMRRILCKGEVNKKLLVYIGGLRKEKNLESLLPMMKRRDDVCLAIIGDGDYRSTLEETFRGTSTVFTGHLSDEHLSEAYASGDAFIYPAPNELVGLTLVEAMASGTLIIAVYSPLAMEQLHNEIDSLLYSSGDENALDAAINRLNDKEGIKRMRRIALREARSSSWERASQQLLDYYSIAYTKNLESKAKEVLK